MSKETPFKKTNEKGIVKKKFKLSANMQYLEMNRWNMLEVVKSMSRVDQAFIKQNL
jgi:hypothetical protein